MKKLLLAVAAFGLLLTSCQNDLDLGNEVGGTALVTFDVTAPALSTRAIANDYTYGNGASAKELYYAVYDVNDNHLAALDGTATMNDNGEASVKVKLTTGNQYKFLFWAQAAGAPYTLDFDAQTLTVDYEGVKSNNENLDAFCNDYEASVITVARDAQTESVTLKRPFAQLNIGANDYEDSVKAGYTPTLSSVTVTNIYNTLNLATGVVTGEQVVTYEEAEIPVGNFYFEIEDHEGEDYKYLAMNYLLVNEKKIVEVDFTLNDGTTAKEYAVSYVPVERNHRTNIYGQVLTGDVTLNVSIDPIFEDDYYRDVDTHIANVTTPEELAAALADDHKRVEITLANDIELPIELIPAQLRSSGQTKLGGNNTDEMIIDLNGNTLTIATSYRAILGAYNTEATITLKNGTVKTDSTNEKITWNEYNIGLADCAWVVEGVEFGKSVALDTTTATLNDVTITESKDLYGLWIEAQGQTVTIDGLTLEAGRGIKIDEQYVENSGAQIAKVTLNVANATFKTQKYAAVVVNSPKGAVINWGEGNNIAGVAEDTTYAVWVDKSATAYASEVVVNGAQCKVQGDTVATAEALAAALTANDKYIVVYLANDIELPLTLLGNPTNGTGEWKLGGANTEIIIIDLGGYKLTATTDYMSSLGAQNPNATITLKNGDVTSTGNSALTWNVYDLGLVGCAWVVENVNFGKSVALGTTSATLKNVTITESQDLYALWIEAQGQTVTIDGLTVNAGRGIKIDEQYQNTNVAKVTLNIANATFTTAAKAAVVVKSVEGAEINWGEGNSISGVAADTEFAVWVDEDADDYAYKVVVNGAKCKVEGGVWKEAASQDELKAAIANNATIVLSEGEYTMPSTGGKNVTIEGTKDTIIAANKANLNGGNLTLNGVTITAGSYNGFQHSGVVIYNNCTIVGQLNCYGTKDIFNNCTFELPTDQYVWTYGSDYTEFNNCVFNTAGKAILVYNEGVGACDVHVVNCTFNASTDAGKAAIEIDNYAKQAHKVTTSNNTVGENFSCEWRIKKYVEGAPVTVNGTVYTSVAEGNN